VNSSLAEINALYLQIEPLFDPSSDLMQSLEHLSDDDLRNIQETKNDVLPIYRTALAMAQSLIPSLTPDEIIEGYQEGSRLLQRNLSGYMGVQWQVEYIPVMIAAIEQDHDHTAWIFLHILADKVGRDLALLYIKALDSQSSEVREAALVVIDRLCLRESLIHVERLTRDSNPTLQH
jgi:hypothetical protein